MVTLLLIERCICICICIHTPCKLPLPVHQLLLFGPLFLLLILLVQNLTALLSVIRPLAMRPDSVPVRGVPLLLAEPVFGFLLSVTMSMTMTMATQPAILASASSSMLSFVFVLSIPLPPPFPLLGRGSLAHRGLVAVFVVPVILFGLLLFPLNVGKLALGAVYLLLTERILVVTGSLLGVLAVGRFCSPRGVHISYRRLGPGSVFSSAELVQIHWLRLPTSLITVINPFLVFQHQQLPWFTSLFSLSTVLLPPTTPLLPLSPPFRPSFLASTLTLIAVILVQQLQ